MLSCKTMLKNISKGQSSIPLRYLIAGLEEDYKQLKNNIRIMFIDIKDESVTMYFKAPSSTFKQLMYDIVFEFHGHKLERINTDTMFKVYCNSPSFYFRYANKFRNLDALLYPSKYPAMVSDEAKIRNPSQVSGFDKYVYSCLRSSMLNTIIGLKENEYLDHPPEVDNFNKKRFEYIKLQKLKKVSEDGLV